ncbi:MAG: tetraacyldisaccharide 4'-kinase [Phycisphaerales bacterium]|nr:tetraacyldisaccharide 4'-kinase [Phycisphaerales bacterium]
MAPESGPADAPLPRSGHAAPPPLPGVWGRLLEPFYRAAINRRNRNFDAGESVTRFDVPVISIGNLSVGGTGKSPMVAHVVGALLRAGLRPCIAMRGYGRRRHGDREHAPDETDAYRRTFPDLPIVAQPDRSAGIRARLNSDPAATRPNCIVLDDGFQHRRIARDLDIVLIDASRSPFNDRLLPAGWQREPAESLRRASLVVLTHAELADAAALLELDRRITAIRGGRPVEAVARHTWTGLWLRGQPIREGDGERLVPLDWLLGKRVVASCAIGNPEGFLHSLRTTLGADSSNRGELIDTLILRDHHPYDPRTVRALAHLAQRSRADAIVITDKDWSKLRRVPSAEFHGIPIARPHLALAFDRGGGALDRAVLGACAR